MKRVGLVLAAGLALVAGVARAQMRVLDVPPTAGWKHAASRLILMPKLGGQVRARLADLSASEFDMVASYGDEASGTYTTLYLFHPGLDSVPVWFDRVRVAAVSRKEKGVPDGSEKASPFSVRPDGVVDGLRITYALKGGTDTSTAAAVAPIDDWLVVVRMSSERLDAAAIDARLTALLHDIRWPAVKRPVAVPVEACADSLKLKKARLLKPNMMQALMGSAMAMAADKAKEKPEAEAAKPIVYCRDSEDPGVRWAMYRANGAKDSYVLAIGDAGRAVMVGPSISGLVNGGGEKTFSLMLADLDRSLVFPDVDRLPPPEQALEIVSRTQPVSSASKSASGSNVTINSGVVGSK